MANNFFVNKNLKVGKSLVEKNVRKYIEDIYKKAERNSCEILIPRDCVVGTSYDGTGKNKNIMKLKITKLF